MAQRVWKSDQQQSDIQLSKTLTWLLRHGAHEKDLVLKDGGFVDIKDILMVQQIKSKNWTEEDILQVVSKDDKKRFSVRTNSDGILQIRANQGHSIKGITNDELLINISQISDLPENIIHGTYLSNWKSIKEVGLSRMKRNHIHFSVGLPGDTQVVSGMRSNTEVHIYVDAVSAMKDGFKFYRSENEVILCEGNDEGILPPKYFKEVWSTNPLKKLN